MSGILSRENQPNEQHDDEHDLGENDGVVAVHGVSLLVCGVCVESHSLPVMCVLSHHLAEVCNPYCKLLERAITVASTSHTPQ